MHLLIEKSVGNDRFHIEECHECLRLGFSDLVEMRQAHFYTR